jgi:MerR family transcriptional regulator, light-induced transcriptional regulator
VVSATSSRPGEAQLTISAVASMLAIPIPTIRSWERRYGFPTPARTGGRHRRYSTHEVELLRALRDEITRGHPAGEAVEVVRRARRPADARRDVHLDAFLDAAMGLDPEQLRRTLDGAAEAMGVDRAISDVALPAMREMGTRWRTGTCDVAHEHVATDAVRAWLARVTATASPRSRRVAIVLACGPNDLHTVGLEAFGALLARRGWPLRTLGALTPPESLVTAIRSAGAAAAIVASQRSVTRRAATASIAAARGVPGVRVFFAGDGFASPAARRGIPGIYLGDDVLAAVDIVERTLREVGAGSERRAAGA